jgi:hypothetical protein
VGILGLKAELTAINIRHDIHCTYKAQANLLVGQLSDLFLVHPVPLGCINKYSRERIMTCLVIDLTLGHLDAPGPVAFRGWVSILSRLAGLRRNNMQTPKFWNSDKDQRYYPPHEVNSNMGGQY